MIKIKNNILMKYVITILFFVLYSLAGYSHEEPAKTLKEKKDKEFERKKIRTSKIKTTTAWKYVVENGKQSHKKNIAFVMGYDSKGYFVFIEAYKNDSLTERDEYAYSAAGDMVAEIDYSPEKKILEKNTFAFDAEGRLISGVSKTDKDSIDGYFKILHGIDNKSIEFVKYKAKDSLDYNLVYKYADDYDKSDYTVACKYDANAKLLMKVEKEYNLKGLQTKKTIFDGDKKMSYYFIYEYDAVGNNAKITKKLADDSIVWVDYYTYDKNGNCTEVKSFDAMENLTTDLKYTFEYYD